MNFVFPDNLISLTSQPKRLKTINYKKLKRKPDPNTYVKLVNAGWVFLILLMGARTVRRNLDWRSDESLYQSGISVCPAKGESQKHEPGTNGAIYLDARIILYLPNEFASALAINSPYQNRW